MTAWPPARTGASKASRAAYRAWQLFNPNAPWYTPGAVRYLSKMTSGRESRVFEWGSGASTLWYAARASQVVSVEHDLEWWEQVNERLGRKYRHAACLHVPMIDSEQADSISWQTDWAHFEILGHAPAKPRFRDYMAAIDKFADGYFDLVAVDGRARVGCVAHALPKLKRGGVLLLDNSNRPRYERIFELLQGWRVQRFNFGVFQTALFHHDATNPR